MTTSRPAMQPDQQIIEPPGRLAPDLGLRLAELARSLHGEDDVQGTLDAVVAATVHIVPGAAHASISAVRRRREVVTVAATDDVARAVDRAQYATGQGPCLDSLFDQLSVRVDDMASEVRWPDFAVGARSAGVGSMLSVQLFVDGRWGDLGALNISGSGPGAFTEESEYVALLLASHAAVAMAGAQETAGLQSALRRRDTIGMAKGVLIERHRATPEQAFEMLSDVSQQTNRKVLEIAQELVDTGVLPGPPPTAPPHNSR